MSRRQRVRSGQALLEFALVLPLLMALMLGIISFGLYVNAVVTISQAVRIGARAAAIGRPLGCPGDSAAAGQLTIYGYVDDQINHGFGLTAPPSPAKSLLVPLPTETASSVDPAEDNVTVTVTYAYQPILPIPGLLPSTVTLAQSYTMMMQAQPPPGSLAPNSTQTVWTYVLQCP